MSSKEHLAGGECPRSPGRASGLCPSVSMSSGWDQVSPPATLPGCEAQGLAVRGPKGPGGTAGKPCDRQTAATSLGLRSCGLLYGTDFIRVPNSPAILRLFYD